MLTFISFVILSNAEAKSGDIIVILRKSEARSDNFIVMLRKAEAKSDDFIVILSKTEAKSDNFIVILSEVEGSYVQHVFEVATKDPTLMFRMTVLLNLSRFQAPAWKRGIKSFPLCYVHGYLLL